VGTTQEQPLYSRRQTTRVEAADGVWVYWQCDGRDDVSRVRDLSAGGLCIATSKAKPVGLKAKIDFLVPEGPIRAEALVRHVKSSGGLGLKFTALTEQDSPRLAALMTRLGSPSRTFGNP